MQEPYTFDDMIVKTIGNDIGNKLPIDTISNEDAFLLGDVARQVATHSIS